jgi:hypothetical protein
VVFAPKTVAHAAPGDGHRLHLSFLRVVDFLFFVPPAPRAPKTMNYRNCLVLRRSGAVLGLVAGLLLGPLTGCPSRRSDANVISGKVTSGGAPLGPLSLRLHYSSGSMFPIAVREDGTFSIGDIPKGTVRVTFHGIGVGGMPEEAKGMEPPDMAKMQEGMKGGPPPGLMEKMRAAAAKIPKKYTNPDTTPESVTIAEGSVSLHFDLKE